MEQLTEEGKMVNTETQKIYNWFADLVNSDKGKIGDLSDIAQMNWILSLFYLVGIDKTDLVMKNKIKRFFVVQTLIETAYHEAGHAVYHWLHGWVSDGFGIIISPAKYKAGFSGMADMRNTQGVCGNFDIHNISEVSDANIMLSLSDQERFKVQKDAMSARYNVWDEDEINYAKYLDVMIAGFAAGNRLRELLDLEVKVFMDEDSSDYWQAEGICKRIISDDEAKRKEYMKQQYDIVKEGFHHPVIWQAVEELAKTLLVQNHIGSKQFIEIMRRIDPPINKKEDCGAFSDN